MAVNYRKGTASFRFIKEAIKNAVPKVKAKIRQFLKDVVSDIIPRVQANAPILESDLRNNIRASSDGVRESGAGVGLSLVVDVPYAYRMHEQLTPAGSLQLGPISSQQPMTPEGGVGGKFIERVVQYHSKRYEQMLKERLSKLS